MRQPGPQNPGKYPFTGPNYAKYGEQPGYIYYPWTDQYYIDPKASNEFLEEQGARKPEKEPPSKGEQIGTAAAIAGGTAIAAAVGNKLIEMGFGEGGKKVTKEVLEQVIKEEIAKTGQKATVEAVKQVTNEAAGQVPNIIDASFVESGTDAVIDATATELAEAGTEAVAGGAAEAVTPQATAAAKGAEAGGKVAAAGGTSDEVAAAVNEAATEELVEAGWSYADIAAEAVKWAAIAYEAYQFYQIHEDEMMDGGEKAQQAVIQSALIVADVWTGGMASIAYGAAKQFDEFNEFEEGFLKYDLGAAGVEHLGEKLLGDITKNTEYQKIMQASDGGYLDGLSAVQLAAKSHGVDHIRPDFDKELAAAKGYDEAEQERIYDYATKIASEEFDEAEMNLMGEDIWGYSDFMKEAANTVQKDYMNRIDGSDEHYMYDERLTESQRYQMAQAMTDYNRANGGEFITGDKGTYDFHIDDVLAEEFNRISAGEQYDPSRIGVEGPAREMPDIKDLGVWNSDMAKLRELWEEGGLDWNNIPEEFVKGRITPEQWQQVQEHMAKIEAQRKELEKTKPRSWDFDYPNQYDEALKQWEAENAELLQMLNEGKLIYPDEGAPDKQPGGKPEGEEPFVTDPEATPPPPGGDTQHLDPNAPQPGGQEPVPTPRGGFSGNARPQEQQPATQDSPPQGEQQMNTRRYSFPQQQAAAQAGQAIAQPANPAMAAAQTAASGATQKPPTIISQDPADAAAAQAAFDLATEQAGIQPGYDVDPGRYPDSIRDPNFHLPEGWKPAPGWQPLQPQQITPNTPNPLMPVYTPQPGQAGQGLVDAVQGQYVPYGGGQGGPGYEPDPNRPGHFRRRQ